VSTLTIKNRYNRLKKTGIIKGSTVIATEEHIHGGECIGDLCITVDSKKINQFIEYVNILFKNKCPVLPVKFNQEYNVAVMVLAKNIQEIQETKDKLGQHADVIRIRVAIWTAIRNTPQNLDPKPL
jgi:DNA-binding Lrp family transcriptional regulator